MNLYKKFHAWALTKFNEKYERLIYERKRQLFDDLSGVVVEIGPGSGPNLKFLNKEITWIGIEPNLYSHSYILNEAARLEMRSVEIRELTAERLPLDDNSVDAVISTLALCTVPNQSIALSEIHRVLKPGGKFIFIEHVAAPEGSFMRRFQSFIKPFWKIIADGCHPDRETFMAIRAANFSDVQGECFHVYNTFVSPHIAGVARK
jgi:ubiquinone/menaquinone biosynthesis C-methylase UbiE